MEAFSFILYVFLAVVILLVMITIHEFGHYLAGKLLKFKINEFSIGFGPALFSKINSKTNEKFSLRAVPLGGYCAFEDEEGAEGEENPKSFVKEAPWKRIIVLLAGGVFNLLSAFIFSFIFILVVGFATPTVGNVVLDPDGSPYNALQQGDRIVAVNGIDVSVINDYDTLMNGIGNDGEPFTVTVVRDGEEMTVSVKKQTVKFPNADGTFTEQDGKLGFYVAGYEYETSFGVAVKEFVPYTFKLSWLVIDSLWQMLTGKVHITEMTGTVGTVAVMAQVAQIDWRNIFILLPLLASNLGIFNLLPIPALDGSKVVFTTIEWIRKKPINRKVEAYIHSIGLILLLAFVVVIDILHFAL